MTQPDPLRLTEADIAAAEASARRQPIMPRAITITADDLTAVPPQPTTTPALHQYEQHLLRLVNDSRRRHLPRWPAQRNLHWHAAAAAVARGHAADMIKRHYVDHVSPDGVGMTARLKQAGIGYIACGENIGAVTGAASHSRAGIGDIHHTFMDQPPGLTNHRANVLNPLWTHVGIGVAYDERGTLTAVQIFLCTHR